MAANLASLVLLLLPLLMVAAQPVSEAEWRALLDLRSSLGISAKNWHKKANPCLNWTGIECRSGRVAVIRLSGLRRSLDGRRNPRFAVDSLPSFSNLLGFISSGFLLGGQIPDWFGQKMSNLQVLDLSSSSVSGSIPPSFGSLSKLISLNLSSNSITGNMPATAFANLHSLSVVDLSQNFLTGRIPVEVSTLANLTKLDLSSNYLSGEIPLRIGLLSRLTILNLSNNSLSSSIPLDIGNLSLIQELDLGSNSLSGELPQELRRLKNLKYLDVSRNNLTGVFTASFNVAAGLLFNFSENMFYGNVSGSGFRNVNVVDLSSNYFGGQAPNGTHFLLSYNCFSRIGNQRNLKECSEFYMDVDIPFGDDRSAAPPSLEPSKKEKSRLPYVMIGVFGGIGLIFIVVAGVFLLLRSCMICSRNQKSHNRDIREEDVEQPPKFLSDFSSLGESFTFEKLLVATSNFSSESLIKQGQSGSLYRAMLEGGEFAVVKKVDLNSVRRESFMSELEFFGKVAHPRLVPLIGHCLDDENVKFLVYKYMPNGDLSNAFYRVPNREEGLQTLDWITRLKIAIGAAEALSYLHNECTPPIVHRDIQASSILLDDKYEVRLGSFSEACALGGNQKMVARLLWSPHARQVSGSSATCGYDVYCFGKVLLELVTGKLGMNDGDGWVDNSLTFISIYEKELVMKIVDQSLIIDEDLLEEVWAVAVVAKSCLNPKPSRRPSMTHVLKALENPFKVVRDDNFRTGSSSSWTAALFGSWNRSSSDSSNKDIIGGLVASSSHKRSSSDVFPQPEPLQIVT